MYCLACQAPLALPPRDSADPSQNSGPAYKRPSAVRMRAHACMRCSVHADVAHAQHALQSEWRYVKPLYDTGSLATPALAVEDEDCAANAGGCAVPVLSVAANEMDEDEEEDERYAHAGDA